MRYWDRFANAGKPLAIKDMYMAPGHLIRRCHQISLSIFADELGEYELTSIQYASLLAVHDRPGIDQRRLGNTIAIDRSTITTVLKGLEARKLVRRVTPEDNMRVKRLYITKRGEALLSRTVADIARVQQRLLSPLSPKEQEVFMGLLSRLVDVNNDISRVPLKIED